MTTRVHVGSPEHRRLLSRFFLSSHFEYTPERMTWPHLDPAEVSRLAGFPFWPQAVFTERKTARIVQRAVALEWDPQVREAIALQGFEEGRHAKLLEEFTHHYGIPVPELELPKSSDLELDFLKTGYAECFDSFFAFGMFRLARDAKFVSPELLALFDMVMQEEARHILFFVNWVAARRARLPLGQRVRFVFRCASALASEAITRVQVARQMKAEDAAGKHFTMAGHNFLDGDFTPGRVLTVCLEENERRISRYDARLLRPRLVPTMVRMLLKFPMPRRVSAPRREAALAAQQQQMNPIPTEATR